MDFQLIWSPSARLNLKDIAGFIAEDSPSAAERLPHFAASGRVVPVFDDPAVREVVRKPCRIVYGVDHEMRTVAIVRVWHAARGVPDIE